MEPANLSDAAFRGDVDLVERLLESGASIEQLNEMGRTPLMSAVQGDHLKLVAFLLERGANPDAKGRGQFPVLIQAVELACDQASQLSLEQPRTEIIELLLRWGANFKMAEKTGLTPLQFAHQQGARNIERLLVEAGATK